MGLKKRTRVKAEFNMSSLTDIIFLLLIFFMLTSSIVIPNALNLRLPSSSHSASSASQVSTVRILSNGSIRYNNRSVNIEGLNQRFSRLAASRGEKATVKISPDGDAPTQYVIMVMDAARKNKVNAILDTPEN